MAKCSKCPARIIWAVTSAGKAMPVDHDPNPAGNLILEEDGIAIRCRPVDLLTCPQAPRYMPHWATCPAADEFRPDKSGSKVKP